jgi:hypothetical protein
VWVRGQAWGGRERARKIRYYYRGSLASTFTGQDDDNLAFRRNYLHCLWFAFQAQLSEILTSDWDSSQSTDGPWKSEPESDRGKMTGPGLLFGPNKAYLLWAQSRDTLWALPISTLGPLSGQEYSTGEHHLFPCRVGPFGVLDWLDHRTNLFVKTNNYPVSSTVNSNTRVCIFFLLVKHIHAYRSWGNGWDRPLRII